MVLSLENMTEAIIIKRSQSHLCSHHNNILRLNTLINNVHLCFVGWREKFNFHRHTFIHIIFIFFISSDWTEEDSKSMRKIKYIVLQDLCIYFKGRYIYCKDSTVVEIQSELKEIKRLYLG